MEKNLKKNTEIKHKYVYIQNNHLAVHLNIVNQLYFNHNFLEKKMKNILWTKHTLCLIV